MICAWLDWRNGLIASLPQDILLGIVLVPLFVWAWRTPYSLMPARISMLFLCLSFIPSIPQEFMEMPVFLIWMPVVSLLSFYFFGFREGMIWAIAFLALVVGECVWIQLHGEPSPYSGMLIVAVIIYLFLSMVAAAFQYMMETYERRMLQDFEARQAVHARMAEMQRLEISGVLAAGVAHDFNNLLVGVMGNAELALLDDAEHKPVAPFLEDILLSSRRGAELVRQLLAFSGQGGWRKQQVDLNGLIGEVRSLVGASVCRRADVKFTLAAGLPAVEVDPTQLQQVVINLLVNGADAIPSGRSGRIEVQTSHADYPWSFFAHFPIQHIEAGGHFVVVEVRDNGTGIPDGLMNRIFEPFFSSKEHGSGLGLAAVAGVMRTAGGAVEVISQQGEGTCFRLYFPALMQATRIETGIGGGDTGSMRGLILLVDDEPVVRQVARRMLERAGLSVLEAVDGQQALQMLAQQEQRISLVLLDFSMPGMNGYQVFRLIRRDYPALPVVVSSGYGEIDEIMQLRQQGALFAQKPYGASDLLAVVATGLKTG
ncbi:response regulator [Mariprofundus erugo]|uniref:histidine kinase n=1 Tax=Mariprofundus erugo TaxID=2528639 RepID=A0A5R9GT86_9PROT|nr:response regulator [Mariprofundus erugo]TLS66474.1 response regulator [Mariprofundus erugo]